MLQEWGYDIVGPIAKKMMCGDVGTGAMTEVPDIVSYVLARMGVKQQGYGQSGLVTKG